MLLGMGMLICLGLDVQEEMVFRNLVNDVKKEASPAASREELAISLMSRVNSRLNLALGAAQQESPQVPGSLHSSLDQLSHPLGACTSYSQVLAKALLVADFDVRKVGLEKNGQRAVHHVLEARIGNAWVLMDPIYNLVFRKPDGALASVAEVSRDWLTRYRLQVPPGYLADCDYSAYYYTNWDRVPLVGRYVRAHPGMQAWLLEHRVSLRFWFINLYRWAAVLTGIAALSLLMIRRQCQRRWSTQLRSIT